MGTHLWSSTPGGRGRRQTAHRSAEGFGTCPVKLPELSQKNPAVSFNSGGSVYEQKQRPAGQTGDVRVVQSEGTTFSSAHAGLKDA